MLSKNHFFWDMTKKYIIAFSHIFNDIHILRTSEDGDILKDITVPITYAGKRKIFSLMQRNPTIGNKVSTILPRISFLITDLEADPDRKLNPTDSISISVDSKSEDFMYNPIPYNFNIDMVIWSKHMDDLLQIIEQSVTFFNPHYTLTVKEIESLGITRNVPVVFNNVTLDMETELDEENSRTLMANMNFTLKGFLYPPITNSTVIDFMNIKFIDEEAKAISNINLEWNEITQEIDEIKTEGADAEWPDWIAVDNLDIETDLDKRDLGDRK